MEDYLKRRDNPSVRPVLRCITRQPDGRTALQDFLDAKDRQKASNELSQGSWNDYVTTCRRLIELLGRNRKVEELNSEDFGAFRVCLSEGVGAQTASNRIRLSRIVFRFAEQDDLIEGRLKFGAQFKVTSRKTLRKDELTGANQKRRI